MCACVPVCLCACVRRHKSNLPLPQQWRRTGAPSSPASVGISVANHSGGVIKAGSAIIFTEARSLSLSQHLCVCLCLCLCLCDYVTV